MSLKDTVDDFTQINEDLDKAHKQWGQEVDDLLDRGATDAEIDDVNRRFLDIVGPITDRLDKVREDLENSTELDFHKAMRDVI